MWGVRYQMQGCDVLRMQRVQVTNGMRGARCRMQDVRY